MSSEVKRWHNWCIATHQHNMMVSPEGNWVQFTDYQAEVARREESDHQSAHWKACYDSAVLDCIAREADRNTLAATVERARNIITYRTFKDDKAVLSDLDRALVPAGESGPTLTTATPPHDGSHWNERHPIGAPGAAAPAWAGVERRAPIGDIFRQSNLGAPGQPVYIYARGPQRSLHANSRKP